MRRILIIVVLIFLIQLPCAFAWDEMHWPDSKLVERSEVIVVAHIKPGSVLMKNLQSSYEGSATLLVDEWIKGKFQTREIPVFIAYGLLPVPARNKDAIDNVSSGPHVSTYDYHTGEPIILFDDNPSEGDTKIIDDLSKDQVWLLRHGANQQPNGQASVLGVWDPQDVQPLNKEADLRKYLR